ncbi:homogentisate 1,2-dioxygenase [Leptodontidium sp. MPI-SDFR-AT-0119]|nr:homogentisate 1,2-dioxygenase [Leptodontidium sp. MPI-SDFR-AT-0119]
MSIYATKFTVPEKYEYLNGFGNHHETEALPGALPLVNSHPKFPPYGTKTEKISGTAFVAPRNANLQTNIYRAQPSFFHTELMPFNHDIESANPSPPKHLDPNSHMYPNFEIDDGSDWTQQRLFGTNGSARTKTGVAMWIFSVTADMKPQTVFTSLDGDALISPQFGSLDIITELGKLLVRAHEIAVIPRGVRYRVDLVDGEPCRGTVCELYQGHFRIPELGIIGSHGLANSRDFQIPKAFFDGSVEVVNNPKIPNGKLALGNDGHSDWTIISRLDTKLWKCTQASTPFNVLAWHGTLYPYKYDLARFSHLSNAVFDHHDPSLFVVLTAPALGKEPNTAVCDFLAVSRRWEGSRDTQWLPWYHRNTMQEFVTLIVNNPALPLGGKDFKPFGAWLNGSMIPHGSTESEYKEWQDKDTSKGGILMDDGLTVAMHEMETPLVLTDWAFNSARKNFKDQMEASYGAGKQTD